MTLTYEEFAKDPMKYMEVAETEEILLTKRNAVYLHLVNPNAEKLKAARALQGSVSGDFDASHFIR